MDSKFAVLIAICFWIGTIYVRAAEDLNESRIFSITGPREFRRHSHLDVDVEDVIRIDEDATGFLKKYLALISRQTSEFIDTGMKKKLRGQLPLPTSYVRLLRGFFIATNVYYEGQMYAIRRTSLCSPLPREGPGERIVLEANEINESPSFHNKTHAHHIKIEQQIELKDLEIRGILTDEGGAKAYNFELIIGDPFVKSIYYRAPTASQGVVTKSSTEVLTFQNINMDIMERGTVSVKTLNATQNMQFKQKIAEAWLAPIVDAIQNRYTMFEVFHQSKIYFSKFLKTVLRNFIIEILSTISECKNFQDPDYEENRNNTMVQVTGYMSHDFDRFEVTYYDSVPQFMSEFSCCDYIFTHLFYMKFESILSSMQYPRVQYLGRKKVADTEDGGDFEEVFGDPVPVRELSLKFEIDTDKFGKPISMTKNYRVTLKLDIDDTSPDTKINLKMQEKMEELMTEYYQEKINNLVFGSTV